MVLLYLKTVKSNHMKKLIFSLVAVATLSFAACNNSSTGTSVSDSTACDSICADSTYLSGDSTKTVDTTANIK
jgi:predicted small secreted protein